ncbi:MAG: glycoside hydrolase family 127 protein [Prevotella sp.]|nr:glycoside hydrolase family 127 protein [Prevotella sp.]
MKKNIFINLSLGLFFLCGNSMSASKGDIEVSIVDRPSVKTSSSLYVGNRQPLLPNSFIKLPVGKVTPKGWTKRMLELQRDGLAGQLGEISAWLNRKNNAWLNAGGEYGWEEVPYWLKGYGNMAYILNDPEMIAEAKTWIEAAIKSRQPDGYFGPVNERDGKRELWANMIMLWCLQSYYEYSNDNRVIDLMTNYFKWQLTVPDGKFLKDYWENSRGGDNIHSVYWLYNITGDSFLLELVHKIHRNTADWMQDSSFPNWHNVNIAQGFREPATYYMLTKDPAHLHATYNNHELIRRTFGQVSGGMFGADENARMGYIDPRQGTETCGFVEQMASDEMMLWYTGDPVWAEHCENVAFNSYPATMTPDLKSLRYITCPNHVQSDSENHKPGIDNGGPFLAMNPFSSRCCQHNHAQGWPYFIENLILATPDNGAAAVIYSACEAKVKVGNGTEVVINEDTQYPFDEAIRFKVNTPGKVRFPFYLRIPSWTRNARLEINGKKTSVVLLAGKYACIDREWSDGDIVKVVYPMELSLKTWQVNKNSVSVDYGPLTLSLNIDEEYRKVDAKESAIWDSKWQETADPSKWPSYEIYPKTPWNYALVLDKKNPFSNFAVEKRAWPSDNYPFTQQSSPVVIKAKGRQVPSWKLDRYKLCGVLPEEDCVKSSQVEDITLVPMGTARLRITSFPASYK